MASDRIVELFGDVLDRPESEREEYLNQATVEDPKLRAEVLALLSAHRDAAGTDAVLDGAGVIELLDRDDERPRRVGPYRLVSLLGRGGMGTVYLAERDDGEFEQRVALKLVNHGMESQAVQRFVNERQILARLQHPLIARLHDGGLSEDGRPYFAMELVEGRPLTEYCDRHRLPVTRRLELFQDVCRAVQHAHANLVVHRDLKPSNILVSDDGAVKLLDFGIARLLDEAGAGITRTGQRLLTPHYAAPEQLSGEPITVATDVYGLGLVLYELLTGRRPFAAGTGPESVALARLRGDAERPSSSLIRRSATGSTGGDSGSASADPGREGRSQVDELESICRARSTSPERLRRRLAGDLDAICLRALEREPARRYGSVASLLADVERHLSGLPVEARRGTVRYRAIKFVKRNRIGVLAAALVMLSILAGLAGTSWQARKARIEAERAVAVKEFVLDLFRRASPNVARGEDPTASQLLAQGGERIEEELAGQPELRVEMLSVLGEVNFELGNFDAARALYERALAIDDRVLGWKRVAELHQGLGRVAVAQGRYEEGERLFRSSLDLRRGELGPDHVDVSVSLNNLAVLEMERGNYQSAAEHLRQAIAIRERQLGRDHESLFGPLQNLAGVRANLGEVEEAVALQTDLLARQRTVLGDEHTKVITTLANLGLGLAYLGRYEEAEQRLEESLALRRKLLGHDHPDVVNSMVYLAHVYGLGGRHEATVAMMREVLAIWRSRFPDDHPQLPDFEVRLGSALNELGRFGEALELVDGARLRLEGRGVEPPELAELEHLAAVANLGAGRAELALQQLENAAERTRRLFPAEDPQLALVLYDKGRALLALGRLGESESCHRQALELASRARTPAPSLVGSVHLELGRTLLAQGRTAEARVELERGHRALVEALGESHPLSIEAEGELHGATEDAAGAEPTAESRVGSGRQPP
ncbi:MAG: hypothetical protein DWQ36_03060 [Acidobacteria bacterium]|nr:MAG: hypothetical protein DWQ30_02345 [Acidobacteriota bacterium]REK11101.1 MAG: hypothetical protein DWQ36_03060 [Acidobacteriota bacterium]